MRDGSDTGPSGSGAAWAELADQFAGIARQFRQHHERLKAEPHADAEPSGGPVQQALRKAGQAIEDAARTIDESVRDPAVRQDSGQARSALIRAVGATLTDLGAALQRQAEPAAKAESTPKAEATPKAVSTPEAENTPESESTPGSESTASATVAEPGPPADQEPRDAS